MNSVAGGLTVPEDPWAETTVVGCAVASRRGAELARARIEAEDIWNSRLRRLYEAALELDQVSDHDQRIESVANLTGIPAEEIFALVDDRPCMVDASGAFAKRVLDASLRRAVMTHCARVYNELAAGARLEEIAPMVAKIEKALPC